MNRIKEVLKDKEISQTWLAKQASKSYNIINEYARNVRQPSSAAARLCLIVISSTSTRQNLPLVVAIV